MTRHLIGNLPAEVTSFVGRRRELAAAKRLLSTTRLLTLAGPGGVGKTRLARRVAAEAQRAFPDGVWLVELASVQQGDLVAQTVSGVLGLRDESPDPAARLASYLRDKQLMLLLDNCEHVLDATADLITVLLAAAPELRVLATSRQVVGVAGEQLLPVQPLSVPRPGEPSSVAKSDAVALFAERATAALPEFAVSPQNRDLVSALCRRLDGIPLAIELAAVRLRAMSLDEIVHRVDNAMRFLVVGDRTAPERQQSLQAAVGWSYDLCSPAERELWQRLSVFSGGFTLAAVQAVCAEGIDDDDVVDVLTSLVDKSVVFRPDPAGRDADRYAMLEELRQYGAAKLAESDDERPARQRHRDHYRRLACDGMAKYTSPSDAHWFQTVAHELPNLRSALEFSLTQPAEAQAALEIGAGLRPYWTHTGYLREGFRWLQRALARDPAPTQARARALSAAAILAALLGDHSAAERISDEGVRLADEKQDLTAAAHLAVAAALLAYERGDLPGAHELAQVAVERGEATGDSASTTEALFLAASVSFELEDPQSTEAAARFLAAAERTGGHLLTACARWISGLADLRAGKQKSADRNLRAAIAHFARFDRPNLIAMGLEALASVAVADEDHDRAARLMGAAQNIWQTNPMPMARQVSQRTTEEAVAQARNVLGAEAFSTAFAHGGALKFDEVVRYAIGSSEMREEQPHVATSAAHSEPTALTRRERQIAELVADGLSNKEIALRLVISPRTAESHVEHILNKLGFNSRAQIAAWVGQHRENASTGP